MNSHEIQLATDAGARYRDCSLENYEVYDKDQKAMIARLLKIDSLNRNIMFIGTEGTGKDHLLVTTMKLAAAAGNVTRLVRFQTLLWTTRNVLTRKKPEADLRPYLSCVVLGIVDPIPSSTQPSRYNLELLSMIVDERYCAGRPTWITVRANDEEQAMSLLGGAAYDRLRHGAEVYVMKWKSYRTKK